MQSSQTLHSFDDMLTKLAGILRCEQVTLLGQHGGGNSLVYCVLADGKKWAVKSYPPYAPQQRDRLNAEVIVYQFLNQLNVANVPLLKSFCEVERWLIIEWIDGEIPQDISPNDIKQAIHFIEDITKLNTASDANNLPLAAEACLSLSTLINQISRRYNRLCVLENEPALSSFLEKSFDPVFQMLKQTAITAYQDHGLNPDAILPAEQRSLIPADFGFHNSIRDAESKLYFFDFDYFGWDDPVKLLADILWHPKMQFDHMQETLIIEEFSRIFKDDKQFPLRFNYARPLFGLRWILILLNEFMPEFWANRQHANAHTDQSRAKALQLVRAQEMLNRVKLLGR